MRVVILAFFLHLLVAPLIQAQFYESQIGQFNVPSGVAVDAGGNVFVTDTNNNRIQKFSSSGSFLTQWGAFGLGDGQFNAPTGIAVDAGGNVYVTDYNNHRIQKFSSTGSFLTKWGTYGSGDGQFTGPNWIAVDAGGNVYVTEISDRIQKFSSSGSFITYWVGISGTTNSGIAVDVEGNVYVAIGSNGPIKKFSGTGTLITQWGISFISPDGLPSTQHGIAVDSGGNVYLTDSNSRIHKYSNSGSFITYWGSRGSGNGQFNLPKGIAVRAGSAYIADTNNNRIQKFSVLYIESLSSLSGLTGTSITITGNSFSTAISDNTVKFNGTPASIAVATATSLTVTVPPLATTGYVTVARQGNSYQSPSEFLVLPLAITSLTPGSGAAGALVTINGTGFSSNNASNVVNFNGVAATVTNSSPTSITTTVPVGSTTGKVTVTVVGVPLVSSTDFNVGKLAITQINSPVFFKDGESTAGGSITVNDFNEVQSIKLKSRGITADDSKIKMSDIPFTVAGNVISFSIPSSLFIDPLGLYYSVSIVEKIGFETSSPPKHVYIKYLSTSKAHVVPDLKTGKNASAYQLISVPLELTSDYYLDVFKNLGAYDDTKWRLYRFLDGFTDEKPPLIQTGKGYWFIMRNQNEIYPGEGNTVKVTKDVPFKISLQAGWNLIGNPYNFTISWDDVMQYNGLSPTVLKFRQYINGAFVSEPVLNRYRGAFVFSDAAMDIFIPIANRSPGGRIKQQDAPSSIDTPSWEVNLSLDDGEFKNELFGFGMNPKAIEGKDIWDEVLLPMPKGISSYNMIFRQVKNKTLVRDIVPSHENYSWQASLSSDHGVTIKWDNSYFGDNNKQLILENPSRVELVDLRKLTSIAIPAGSHTLNFHYGDESYIKKQVLESSARFGNVYPNPVKRGPGTLSIAVSLPEGSNEVALQLKDVYGRGTGLFGKGLYDGVRGVISWQEDFSQLTAGMYLLLIETRDAQGSTVVIHKKIILE